MIPLFSFLSSRKGFEMAISTLVVMILGLLIIGGGAILVTKLTTNSIEINDKLTNKELQALTDLNSKGYLVAVYPGKLTVVAGRTEHVGLMIENRLGADKQFTIETQIMPQSPLQPTDASKLKINFLDTIDIVKNKRDTAAIVVSPDRDAKAGQYQVFVTVKYDESGTATVYDSVRFFVVNVQ